MKVLSCFLTLIVVLALTFIPLDVNAVTTDDVIKISKTGNMWEDYVNMMNIIFPGGTVSGLYYHKLYAKYDSALEGFVVEEKVASHCSYTKKVENDAIGLCFSYNPEYEEGNDFGKKNFKIWNKIRKGDVLYANGINFSSKTIDVEGSLSEGTLETNSFFTVKYLHRASEPTAYTGKTVVALGDSITCNGGWTEKIGELMGCSVINSGVNGDRVTEALARFDSDVKAYSPQIVLVMFGINDCVQYYYSEKTVFAFKNELIELHKKCTEIGAKVVFITPNNIKTESLDFDRYKDFGGIDSCYPKFIEMIKVVSKETGAYLIELYDKFIDTETLLCDTVHPNYKGYEIFSREISNYLISYADIICCDSIEGYISNGEGNFEIRDGCIYISPCTAGELKSFFCNDIKIYENKKLVPLESVLTEECEICWIDKNGVCRDWLCVNIQ